jgi:general secretion pathway protein M
MKMQLTQHRAFHSLSDFWQARNPRERLILTLALAILVLALVYLVLIEPALNAREQSSRQVPQLRQQVAQMQSLAKEAASLPAEPAAAQAPPPLSQESVTKSLTSHGLKPQNLNVSADTVRLQLSDASFSSLMSWLGTARSTTMLQVAEANIVAQSQPDIVNATITLRQQTSE